MCGCYFVLYVFIPFCLLDNYTLKLNKEPEQGFLFRRRFLNVPLKNSGYLIIGTRAKLHKKLPKQKQKAIA